MYRVLMVDDEPQILEGLELLIDWTRTSFYPVDCAYNGIDALRMLESGGYHLLITDIRMPEIDGFQIIEWVCRVHPETMVIILSGYGEFHFAQKAIRLGAIDYLLKPVGADELLSVLHRAEERLHSGITSRRITSGLLRDLFLNVSPDIEGLHKRLQLNRPFCLMLMVFDEACEQMPNDVLEGDEHFICCQMEANSIGVLCLVQENERGDFFKQLAQTLKHTPIRKAVISGSLLDLYQCHGIYNAMYCTLCAMGPGWFVMEKTGITQRTPASLRQVITYINKNYIYNLTLRELSEKFYLNVNYLGQTLNKTLGYQYNHYVMLLRVSAACRYLSDGNASIVEIALRLGYTDVNYFYRQFKTVMNMTVKKYRQLITEVP